MKKFTFVLAVICIFFAFIAEVKAEKLMTKKDIMSDINDAINITQRQSAGLRREREKIRRNYFLNNEKANYLDRYLKITSVLADGLNANEKILREGRKKIVYLQEEDPKILSIYQGIILYLNNSKKKVNVLIKQKEEILKKLQEN